MKIRTAVGYYLRYLLLLVVLIPGGGMLYAQEHTKAFRQGLKETRKSPPDFKKMFRLFVQAADEGDADANFYVGERFRWGEVTIKNYDSAINRYLRGAKAKSSLCMLGLGKVYEKSSPLRELAFYSFAGSEEKYDSLSLYWYRQAALLDNAEALNYFAKNLHNDTLMYYYAQRSAATGNYEGMWLLGNCFKSGIGTTIDTPEAKRWYKLAIKYADFNYTDAKDELDALNGVKKKYEYGVLDYRRYGDADAKYHQLSRQEPSATLSAETRQYNEWWQKTYGNRGAAANQGSTASGGSNSREKEHEQHRRNMDEIQRSIERQQSRDYNRKNN